MGSNSATDSFFDLVQAINFLVGVEQDGTLKYIKINKAHERATGLSNDQLSGKTPSEALGIELGKEIEAKYRRCLEHVETVSYEETLNLPSGVKTWLTSLSPIKKDGRIVQIAGVSTDITEKNRMKKRLELAMDAGEHGLWEHNLETNEFYFSPGYFKMLGYGPSELPMTLDTWHELIHPEDKKTILPKIESFVSMGQPYKLEIRLKCKDGNYKWISTRGKTYFHDRIGMPARVVGVHVDIDDLKRKTEYLKESNKMAQMGRWDYFHHNDLIQWSEGIYPIFESNLEETAITYQGFLNTIYPEDREKVDSAWKNAIMSHQPYNIQHRLLMRDGRIKWLKEFGYTEYDEANCPLHSIGIVQDITEYKFLEEGLRKSEEKFRILFQKHLAVQLLIDPQTENILNANESAVNFYGYSKEELTQMKISQINTLSPQEIKREMEKARTMKRVYFQFKHRLANGEIRDVEVFSNQIEIEGREVLHSIIHDITEKKRNEKELLMAKQQAEAANIAKSEFLATMSHELRTPLNGVIGFSDILRGTQLDAEQNEFLDIVITSAKNLLEIISDILDFSSIEANSFILKPEKTEIKTLIQKTCSMIRHKAVKKGLTFSSEISDAIPQTIEVDRNKLRQVLLNLLSNAVKFTDSGRVTLKIDLVEKVDSQVRLSFMIADTGIGIQEKDQAVIFEAFRQVDMSNTRKYEGTGLGLTISKNLLQKMGATLHLKSTSGKGSIFSFELLLPCNEASEEDPYQHAHEAPEKRHPIEHKKVLIAEDNLINMKYTQTAISMFSKDIEVIGAKNGKEAYNLHSHQLITRKESKLPNPNKAAFVFQVLLQLLRHDPDVQNIR